MVRREKTGQPLKSLGGVFDYSTTETATTLDMTEINVKVTLHRARRIISLSREFDSLRATSHPRL